MRWLLLLLVGCQYTPPDEVVADVGPEADAPEPTTFTLFVADFTAGRVHRYNLEDSAGVPAANLEIQLSGALSPVVLPVTDELLVGEVANAVLARFTTPLGLPTSNGTISGSGLGANMGKMIWVDDQLFVVNPAATDVLRFTFDDNGTPALAGTIPNVTNGRGIVFDPSRRNLYVTECCATNTLLHFGIDAQGTVAMKSMVTGVALSNPHGIVVTPWGELFVANASASEIRRFDLSGGGQPIPGDTITGNGIDVPIDLVLTPWQELYVTNQGGGTISRFTFDAAHTAIPKDNFPVPNAQTVTWATLDAR